MTDPIGFQVTVDAADPHAQARFWASALHYEVEDQDAFIRDLLDQGHVDDDDVLEVDGRLAFRIGAGIRPPADSETSGQGTRVLFLQVPEPKRRKNRVHLDLGVGRDRIDQEVERLTGLGATELYRVDEPGAFHTTMQDPEGNEFCVQ